MTHDHSEVLYEFPGAAYQGYDPMPDNFNYGSYRRYNTTPHYKVADARNTIPLHDSSSDGHFSRDSHQSYTTSDDDGVFSDSDNGFNVGGALK